MNKKGFLGIFTDMLGWFFFFLGMVAWFVAYSFLIGDITYEISIQKGYLDDKGILISILQTPVTESTTVADEVLLTIENPSRDLAKNVINHALNSVYGQAQPICWALWQDDQTLYSVDCEKKQVLLEQSMDIASPEGPLPIRLAILGYT
ncbi:hypothetical protein GOV09_02465 [Candidatus Woesearchaeota archaeon]|nr:hypothetical protein [Candidatus Woesearchaeota archaeon]